MFTRLMCVAGMLLFIGGVSTSARAENLNEKYGPSWNCKYISLTPASSYTLWKACEPCMNKDEDFFQTGESTGYCIPKAGSAEEQPQEAAPPTPPPAPTPKPKVASSARYIVRVCNKTGKGTLWVTVAYLAAPSDKYFTMAGWWDVPENTCKEVVRGRFANFNEQPVYIHAFAGKEYWPTKTWPFNKDWNAEEWIEHRDVKVNMCVPLKKFEHPGTHGDLSVKHPTCPGDEQMRAFAFHWVDKIATELTVKEIEYR